MNPNQANRRRLAKKLGLPTNATWKQIRKEMPPCSICYKKGKLIPCPRSSNPCKEGSVCDECASRWSKCPVCKEPHPHRMEMSWSSSPTGSYDGPFSHGEETQAEEAARLFEEHWNNDHGLFNVREYFRRMREDDDDDLSSISSSSTAAEDFFPDPPDFMEF